MKGKGKVKGKIKGKVKVKETNAPKSGERLANFFSYSAVKRTHHGRKRVSSCGRFAQFSKMISYATQIVMGQRGKRECDSEVYTHS